MNRNRTLPGTNLRFKWGYKCQLDKFELVLAGSRTSRSSGSTDIKLFKNISFFEIFRCDAGQDSI